MNLDRVGQADAPETGNIAEIEVTPEMIEAAAMELVAHDMTGDFDSTEIARLVIVSALASRRPAKPE